MAPAGAPDDAITIESVSFEPDPPKAGANVTVTVIGTAHEDIEVRCVLDSCERAGCRAQEGAYAYRSARRWPPPAPATCAVRTTPRGPAAPSEPGTLQHFLVERYFLYSRANDQLFRGQVHHPPYQVRGADVEGLDESLLAAAGIARPAVAPLAHFSEGVDVDVFALERVGP